MDKVVELLMYCLPSGVFASIATWLVNRKLYHTRSRKEVHDTYKSMYEDLSNTIINQQQQTNDLRRTLAKLQQIIVSATTCKYYSRCPMRLQHNKADSTAIIEGYTGANTGNHQRDAPAARSEIDGEDADRDRDPP